MPDPLECSRENVANLVADMIRDPKVQRIELDLTGEFPTLRYFVQLDKPADFIVVNVSTGSPNPLHVPKPSQGEGAPDA